MLYFHIDVHLILIRSKTSKESKQRSNYQGWGRGTIIKIIIIFKCWHPCGMHLKFICIKLHISTYKKCAGVITHSAATALHLHMVLLRLKSATNYVTQRGAGG